MSDDCGGFDGTRYKELPQLLRTGNSATLNLLGVNWLVLVMGTGRVLCKVRADICAVYMHEYHLVVSTQVLLAFTQSSWKC